MLTPDSFNPQHSNDFDPYNEIVTPDDYSNVFYTSGIYLCYTLSTCIYIYIYVCIL